MRCICLLDCVVSYFVVDGGVCGFCVFASVCFTCLCLDDC